MKSKVITGIVLAALLMGTLMLTLNIQQAPAATRWNITTVDSAGTVGTYTSIALDSGDKPHISYYDNTNKDLKYAYHDGLDWDRTVADSDDGMFTSIALDSGDKPHISYYDHFPDYDLKYAYFDGVSWVNETVDGPDTVGYFTSIALDSGDKPHISYYDNTNGDLRYAYYDGVDWHNVTVDSAGDMGYYTSIALDSGDNPHISYSDWTNWDLKYAFHDGVDWHITTVDSAYLVGAYTSIALDSGDNPHISYYYSYTGDLRYAYYDGVDWHTTTVDSADDVGMHTSIALDSGDNPHISYYDNTNKDLRYAYYDGVSWHNVTVDSAGNVGEWTSIALDSGDNPHISYYDSTNGDLKYAYYEFIPDIIIEAWCYEIGVYDNVSIAMDGSPTGFNTPHNFTFLTGNHTFTVPNTDTQGHSFKQWSTGETSTTITVTSGGTYTAYYGEPPMHDVAVTNVTTSKTGCLPMPTVGQGYNATVNATVENQGELTETFNVTVYADTTLIGTKTNVVLASGVSTFLTFTWDTTGFAYGNYTLSANATIFQEETDIADNTYTDDQVLVSIPGDVDGDRDVDVGDQRKVQLSMFSVPGAPNWNPNMDIDCDLDVDVGDQRKQQLKMFQSW